MLFSNRPSDCAKILHACADRDEISSHLKKIAPPPPQSTTKPILIEGRQPSEGVYKSAMRMRLFPSFANFAFGGNVTLSTSTHRHYDESVHRIEQLTRGNNTIGILMTSYRAFQTRQRPVARYVLFTSRAVHVGKIGVSVCRRGQIR